MARAMKGCAKVCHIELLDFSDVACFELYIACALILKRNFLECFDCRLLECYMLPFLLCVHFFQIQ